MHLAFDVGFTNKRLVLDTPPSKERSAPRERPPARVVEAMPGVELPAGQPPAHSAVFLVLLGGYGLLCASDALDTQPRHGFKCHVAIVASVPPCLLYMHTRDARLQHFVAGVLLHVLALIAVLCDARHQQAHVAVDVLVLTAAGTMYYLGIRGILATHACLVCCIVSSYVGSLCVVVCFRYMQIMPRWSLLALEQTFLVMSLVLALIASRGNGVAIAGLLTRLTARGMP